MSTPVVAPPGGATAPELGTQTAESTKPEELLRAELNVEYNAKLEKAIADEKAALRAKNDEMIKAAIEEWRKEQQPPSEEEVKGLLENTHPGFQFSFRVRGREVKFRIREVASRTERKVLKIIQDALVPHSAQIASITSGLMSGTVEDKIKDFFDAFEPGVATLAEICTVILNACPEDEDQEPKLTVDDVEQGLSMFRQLAVLNAYLAVNRVRDFFLLAFRLMKR